jgi:hypothetical protein
MNIPAPIRQRIVISLFWMPLLLLVGGLGLGLLPSRAGAWPRWGYVGLALVIFGVWYFDAALPALSEWLELYTSKWPRVNLLVVLLGLLLGFGLAVAAVWGILIGLERHIALASLCSVALAITLGSSGLDAWAGNTPGWGLAIVPLCFVAAGIASALQGNLATGVLFGVTWYITAIGTDRYLGLDSGYAGWLVFGTMLISHMVAASPEQPAPVGQQTPTAAWQAAIGAGAALLVSSIIHAGFSKLLKSQ